MPINELDACQAIMLEGIDPSTDEAIVLVHGDSPHDLGVVAISGDGQWSDPGAPAPPEPPPGFLYPGAVKAASDSWVSFDPPKYRIRGGDTFIGLSTTYLGDPARWREIYDLQPLNLRYSKGTRGWHPGDVINMPAEAARNMRAWMKAGEPAHVTPAEKKKAQGGGGGGGLGGGGLSTGAKLALGGAAAFAAYYLLR